MKKLVYILISILVLNCSCKKWIDPSMNVDPNNPTDVSMAQLLAPVEANLAFEVGGELARYTCDWMQHITGLQSQAADNDIYTISEADVDGAWSYNLYTPGMIDTKILMDKAAETGSPYYEGVAKILMAYHLGVATDMWGDVPYSDALKGVTNVLKPKYDTQQEIYASIFTLLDDAISDFGMASSVFSPGDEDLIYGGDLSKWEKTAYALKARYSMHLEKRNGSTAYSDALAAIANSYTSNNDDFKFVFGSALNNSNPIYRSEQDRAGYYSACATFENMLSSTGDPRQPVYFTGAVGSIPGQPNASASSIGPGYASATSPVYLISYAEIKFIEAEARYMLNNADPLAVTAYNDGLKASLQREGVFGDGTWFNANLITSGTITLEKIIDQKYLSSFLQIETWTDWRRTGYPVLSLATGAVTSQIPRRLPYPQSERLYNTENMPAGLTITDRVWWDAAK
ncbi:MAG TPA: SusD/RagB family nutrient-binding outer membrane lipoprotein [Bacteroidales bacterium]|nr:SusD/RagB family nutrient-binding outer membrane lipoprotein [Bacteroidales bacterium]